MSTRFGPQPAKAILREERWTIRRAAHEIGVKEYQLGRAVTGSARPSTEVIDGLVGLLNRPEGDLFTPEALANRRRPGFVPRRFDLTGQRFGRWTVIEPDTSRPHGGWWHSRCDCGVERSVNGRSMRMGRSKSCGCYFRDWLRKRWGTAA